jgi:hypothetical protein
VRARGIIKVLARDLIKVFNGNKRWKATELNGTEASNISIAIATLKLKGAGPIERFIADVGDVIRANLKDATNGDLVNLAKSTHYLRGFEHTRDLYSVVHAEALTRFNLRQLDADEKDMLSKVYSSHGIMTDSPFTQGSSVRVNR